MAHCGGKCQALHALLIEFIVDAQVQITAENWNCKQTITYGRLVVHSPLKSSLPPTRNSLYTRPFFLATISKDLKYVVAINMSELSRHSAFVTRACEFCCLFVFCKLVRKNEICYSKSFHCCVDAGAGAADGACAA